jgi:hypothetical protein
VSPPVSRFRAMAIPLALATHAKTAIGPPSLSPTSAAVYGLVVRETCMLRVVRCGTLA